MKKILVPNGSFHEILIIKELKKMGYYVITSGLAPDGLGHQFADKYVPCDFSDKEAMLKLAIAEEIDNLCSNCNDFGYLTTCYIAEKMGIPGHDTYETAVTLHEKDAFKKWSKTEGILTPIAENFEDELSAKEWLKDRDFPLIVKPTDLGAGQGIKRIDGYEDGVVAIEEAFMKSKAKKIVIEPFVEGTSHSFNAFVVDGKVRAYYSDNEYMKYDNYRVSTSASPADYASETDNILIEQTEIVAKKLGLTDGLVHSQYILDGEHRPHILEITRRMSGDWYPHPEMRATDIDWVKWYVYAQLGMNCQEMPSKVQKKFTGRHCLNVPRKGVIKKVDYKEPLKSNIYDSILWIEDGYEVTRLDKEYPGIIFFEFETREEMLFVLDNIDKYINFVYE